MTPSGPNPAGPPGGGYLTPGRGLNTTLPLVLNIAGFFLCGSFTCLPEIAFVIGFVSAVQAGNLLETGDVRAARDKAKTATTMAIAGWIGGVVIATVGGILRSVY
jgi:hypothetical protein